jgi:hypothetical protein
MSNVISKFADVPKKVSKQGLPMKRRVPCVRVVKKVDCISKNIDI